MEHDTIITLIDTFRQVGIVQARVLDFNKMMSLFPWKALCGSSGFSMANILSVMSVCNSVLLNIASPKRGAS